MGVICRQMAYRKHPFHLPQRMLHVQLNQWDRYLTLHQNVRYCSVRDPAVAQAAHITIFLIWLNTISKRWSVSALP